MNLDFSSRTFLNPQPSFRAILDSVGNFREAVERSLKLGVIRNSKFTLLFRTDVFRFLFNGKGRDVRRGHGRNYDKEDFNEPYFPCNWNRCYDR